MRGYWRKLWKRAHLERWRPLRRVRQVRFPARTGLGVRSLKRREARREAKNRNRNACCPSLAGRMTTEGKVAQGTKSARANHRANKSTVACAQLLSSTVVLHGDSVTRLAVLADLAPREQRRQGRAHVRDHVARCTPGVARMVRTGGEKASRALWYCAEQGTRLADVGAEGT